MDLREPAIRSRQFDFLLLDVPCSGTGTLRSNPDLRWRIGEEDLGYFQGLQSSLIRKAFTLLKPGGSMVYSTCSTEPEENEDVLSEFLAGERSALLEGEFFRTFPEQALGDGFFAARVRRL
jgi:16S rRNA (cytosine967-C5)-methyltransferase